MILSEVVSQINTRRNTTPSKKELFNKEINITIETFQIFAILI